MLHVPHDPASVSTVSPANSRLYNDILEQHTYFLGANLLCSASQAGRGDIPVTTKQGEPVTIKTLHCGKGVPVRIPYYGFMVLMIATTFVQQRQMTRASPAGNQQQQALTKVMPLLFGVWGFIFPPASSCTGPLTNFVQIVQQRVMLGRQAPVADEEGAGSRSSRGGFMGSLRSLINPGADGTGSSSGTKPRSLGGWRLIGVGEAASWAIGQLQRRARGGRLPSGGAVVPPAAAAPGEVRPARRTVAPAANRKVARRAGSTSGPGRSSWGQGPGQDAVRRQ
jgi:hypothetical protein